MTGILRLGPFSIPHVVLIAAAVFSASYAVGAVRLRGNPDSRKTFSDILFSPILPFLLAWKLSLVLTDARDVVADPALILFSTGGGANIALGALAAAAWTARRWRRLGPPAPVNRSLAAAFILIGSAGIVLSAASAAGTSASDRPPAPTSDLDGMMTELSGPVVVNFWATWCPPCRAEMPMLDRLQDDARLRGAAVLTVNAAPTESSRDAGAAWLEQNGLTLPPLVDADGSIMRAYGVAGLPTTVILDSRRRIVQQKTGGVSRAWILGALRQARRGESR